MIAQRYNGYDTINIKDCTHNVHHKLRDSLYHLMPPHVQREMVTSREFSLAKITSEWLIPGMLSIMSS